MNYQVTCVCGHSFVVTESAANRHVACPSCSRALIPLVATATADTPTGTPAPSPAEATKRCPHCGEIILAVARKCRFCHEALDRAAPDASAAPSAPGLTSPADPATLPADQSTPIFVLSVSQWDNFWRFLICATVAIGAAFLLITFPPPPPYGALGIVGITALMMLLIYFFYVSARNSRCTIRSLRLETETGIFSKKIANLELWRVTDIDLKQSLIERLLGIGTIFLKTSDDSSPLVELYQIPKARKVFKYLQEQVPAVAKQRGVLYIKE